MHARVTGDVLLFFFKKKIVWGFYGSDLTEFYQSFIKVISKSGSAAGKVENFQKMQHIRPALRR
jgi:hypothetical protein